MKYYVMIIIIDYYVEMPNEDDKMLKHNQGEK